MINFSELLWKSGRTRTRELHTVVVSGSEELETVTVLARIPTESADVGPTNRIALLTDDRSVSADRFRYLRMRLRELRGLAKLSSLVVTSPSSEDGKSTVAMGLATALAERGNSPILLIEADLHRPSIARALGIRQGPGLGECLESGCEPMDNLVRVEPYGWYLLRAGETNGNPTELLQSAAVPALLQRVSSFFEWILIDTPPILGVTDALSLSGQVDATLMVARAGRTSREAIEESVKVIGQRHLLGIVLNGAEGVTRLYPKYYGHCHKE